MTVDKKKVVAAIYLNQPGGKLIELHEASKHKYRKSQGNVQLGYCQPQTYSQSYLQIDQGEDLNIKSNGHHHSNKSISGQQFQVKNTEIVFDRPNNIVKPRTREQNLIGKSQTSITLN